MGTSSYTRKDLDMIAMESCSGSDEAIQPLRRARARFSDSSETVGWCDGGGGGA
jgi:hypothetical protein